MELTNNEEKMPQLDIICHQVNHPVQEIWVLVILLAEGALGNSQIFQATTKAVGCFPHTDAKDLLLKTLTCSPT